jgi:methionyl-tRNA formyltransferase
MIKIVYFSTGFAGAQTLKYLSRCKDLQIKDIFVTSYPKSKFLIKEGVYFLAKKLGYSPIIFKSWNEVLNVLKKDSVSVCVVCDFGKIIPKSLIENVDGGWWNIHFSLLPKYRGATPLQTAILNGEKFTGTTIFKIEPSVDTGKILCQKKIPIKGDDNFGKLAEKLGKISVAILCKYLPKYMKGEVELIPQRGMPSYCDINITDSQNTKLLWTDSIEKIDRKIRAFSPQPGAWSYFKDFKGKNIIVKIIDGEIFFDKVKIRNKPKELASVEKIGKAIFVNCCNGLYKLKTVSVSGKGIIDALSFWNGYCSKLKSPMFK